MRQGFSPGFHRPLLTVLMLSLPTTGCLPVPMWATEPWPRRFSDEVVASIHAGEMSREQVETALGAPDIRRADDRYWAYGWAEQHGEWYIAPAAPMAGVATHAPVYSTFRALFLEFDASGSLVRAESGHRQGEGVRFCDSRDHCLEHWDFNCLPVEKSSLRKVPYCDVWAGRSDEWMGPANLMSSFTVPATATDVEQAMDRVPDGFCRLVLTVAAELPDTGLEFNVDQLWSEPTWLPRNAFATLERVAGSHEVTGCGSTRASFSCQAGEVVSLVLGDARDRESRCASPALAVNVVPAGAGVATIAGKRRVLLPEASAEANGPQAPQMRSAGLQHD